MLIRTIIVDSGKWVSNLFSEEKDPGGATLMERIIDSRSIELDSPKHKLAMHQFESNLDAIIAGFSEHGIPVYVASVASNLKDQPPFVNITDGDHPPAQKIFAEANSAFSDQRYEEAARQFTFAKDLDGLKFRAPGEINRIIRDATEDSELANYVAVEETLRANARQHIIGNDLMLEHLHPNQEGYFLIGRTFAEKLLEDFVPQATIKSSDLNSYKNKMYLAEFDNRIAWHRVQTLKQGFPFVQDGSNRLYQGNYKPAGLADSLAFNIVHRNSSWDRAKVELGKFYERTGQFEKALLEYQGLIRNQPWNDSPYLLAARIYLDRNDFAHAEPLLEKAYAIYPEDAFTTKMLGAIYVQKGNPEKAIRLLEQSRALNPDDPQMLYNLSGAYGTNKQYEKALEIADEVIEISPGFPGIQQWKQQLERITRN